MRCRKGPHQYSEIESIDLTCYESTDKFVASFVRQMNRRAKQLNLSNTMFGNPHGMTIG